MTTENEDGQRPARGLPRPTSVLPVHAATLCVTQFGMQVRDSLITTVEVITTYKTTDLVARSLGTISIIACSYIFHDQPPPGQHSG